MNRACAALLGGMVLLSAGCATTDIAPHSGPAATLDADERRIWARGREEQGRLDASQFHARMPEVEEYLERIVARLHPDPVPGGARFRVRVLADPTLNAFAMPDGAIYVHTGLMANVENEAQLATVLAHELVHTLHRHGLKGTRQMKNQTAVLATIGAGAAGAGLAGSVVQLLGTVGTLASITGYSRDLERDADTEGFRKLVAAGYDPRESPKVFRVLLLETARAKAKAPYFFSTHPRLQERIASYEQLIQALPPAQLTGRVGLEDYTAVALPVLAVNAESALRIGDFDAAREQAERFLQSRPADPQVAYVLAEAHRKRDAKDDAAKAVQLLRDLARAHPEFPDTYRSLGLALMRQNARLEAARNFHRYLELKPEAADRGYVLEFIRQCES